MNYNKNVVVFTLVTTIILLTYSLFSSVSGIHFFGLENISIVSDVLKPKHSVDSAKIADMDTVTVTGNPLVPTGPLPPRSLSVYKNQRLITNFATDTSDPALAAVMHKLYALKQTHTGKVRIAWLGDSFIEGDLLTKTVRRQAQQAFGGYGAGFIPVTSVVNDGFRTTVSQKWSEDWKEENFKTKELTAPLYLSGRLYYAVNSTLTVKDMTLGKDSVQKLEKSLICGPAAGAQSITVNGQTRQFMAPHRLNRIVLDSSSSHSINIAIQNDKLPIYGVSMEAPNGVILDNFSFRGISGEELGKLDTAFIKTIQEQNAYDLIILEYGVNVLYRPDNTDFSWHKRNMTKVLQKLRAALPNTEFLVISTSDRGFRYEDGNRSAIGIDNLVKTQAELAFNNTMSFFNMFASMGGAGTIVRWADSTPVMAGHDYVHPNQRGAEILGNLFSDAFMKDYEKANRQAINNSNYVTTAYNSIVDKRTNLEWYIGEDKNYTWPEANKWATTLAVDNGHWSMPSVEQLKSLYNKNDSAGAGYVLEGAAYPAKINHLFKNIGHGSWVWSSQDINASNAYSVNLNQGVKVESQKDMIKYPIRVFAVRKWDPQKLQ